MQNYEFNMLNLEDLITLVIIHRSTKLQMLNFVRG